MTDTAKKLGKRIQELRKTRRLTQSNLAELINVETVTISRIENGNRFPQKENLEKIASALNVEIKELFDFEHHKTKTELKKEIIELINSFCFEDLQYIRKFLKIYLERK